MSEMHEATLKIEYVNEPDKKPDFGSIKADGKYWDIPKAMMDQFRGRQGQTVTVGYTTNEGRNGKTYYNIKELRGSAAPAPAPIMRANGQAAPSNGNGKDQHMISALALYNHTCMYVFATSDEMPNHKSMGAFLVECRLAIDWAEEKYQEFWQKRNAPKAAPKPQQVVDDIGDTWAP